MQLTVRSTNANTPPVVPEQGEVHAVGAAPIGDWVGHAGDLAAWLDNAWHFVTPSSGWRAWDENTGEFQLWDSTAWAPVPVNMQNLDGVGVSASSDTTNRLTVRSPATLLTHEGSGHQLKINKASSGDTASLLFQSNWTSHAEMGLSGSTGFSIKVSPDGASWTDALSFDPNTGAATGAAVQSDASETTAGRLMRADFGYGPGNLLGSVSENTGTPTGAVIQRGHNANGEYVRFADGTQICTFTLPAVDCTNTEGALFASSALTWDFPMAFAATPCVSGSGGAVDRFIGLDTPDTTQVNCKVLSVLSDSSALSATVIAVGRWY